MRTEILQKTDFFIRTELIKLANYQDNIPRMAQYRIEHSYRVAYIAAEIARKEGFDEEMAFIAGLLHDIGYSVDYSSKEELMNHGRYGAEIARPFLKELGYSDEQANEMCFGIAIHVDDKADFEGERTPLALTVGDADNIDRFDASRLYEALQNADYMNLPLEEQREFVTTRLTKLKKIREIPFSTATATAMWQEKIDFQISFIEKLKNQVEHSK